MNRGLGNARREYIESQVGISLRRLAQKHRLPMSTVMKRSAKEKWVALREQFHLGTTTAYQSVMKDKDNGKGNGDGKGKLKDNVWRACELAVKRMLPKLEKGGSVSLKDVAGILQVAMKLQEADNIGVTLPALTIISRPEAPVQADSKCRQSTEPVAVGAGCTPDKAETEGNTGYLFE